MHKNKKIAVIVMCVLVGIYALYFLSFVVYNVKNSNDVVSAITTIFSAFMIFGVLSFILLASAFGAWGKLMRKLGRNKEAENYEEAVKENETAFDDVKTKYDKKRSPELQKISSNVKRERNLAEYENELKSRKQFSKKSFITGLAILLACSAVGAVTIWLYNRSTPNLDNGNYIETTAVVQTVQIDGDEYTLQYVYEDENGNRYVFNDNSTFSGVNFREGNTIKIYYDKDNPQIAKKASGEIGLILVSTIFFGVGAIAFLTNISKNSNVLVPIIFGGVFLAFGIGSCILISSAGGFNFLETIMSGPFAFGGILLGSLGLVFVVYGLFCLFREIYYFSLYLRKKHTENK